MISLAYREINDNSSQSENDSEEGIGKPGRRDIGLSAVQERFSSRRQSLKSERIRRAKKKTQRGKTNGTSSIIFF